jgi:hypothetical protein
MHDEHSLVICSYLGTIKTGVFARPFYRKYCPASYGQGAPQIRDIHGILRFMVHTLSGTRELILIDCV